MADGTGLVAREGGPRSGREFVTVRAVHSFLRMDFVIRKDPAIRLGPGDLSQRGARDHKRVEHDDRRDYFELR